MIEPATFETVRAVLDYCVAGQRLTAQNIANAQLKGYRAAELDFKVFSESLEDALAGASEVRSHIDTGLLISAALHPSADAEVSVDKEIVASAKYDLLYQSVIGAYNSLVSIESEAIRGGRR